MRFRLIVICPLFQIPSYTHTHTHTKTNQMYTNRYTCMQILDSPLYTRAHTHTIIHTKNKLCRFQMHRCAIQRYIDIQRYRCTNIFAHPTTHTPTHSLSLSLSLSHSLRTVGHAEAEQDCATYYFRFVLKLNNIV